MHITGFLVVSTGQGIPRLESHPFAMRPGAECVQHGDPFPQLLGSGAQCDPWNPRNPVESRGVFLLDFGDIQSKRAGKSGNVTSKDEGTTMVV